MEWEKKDKGHTKRKKEEMGYGMGVIGHNNEHGKDGKLGMESRSEGDAIRCAFDPASRFSLYDCQKFEVSSWARM